MTIELARRLIGAGAPVAAVEAALTREVADGTPFVLAISQQFPNLLPLVERELSRVEAPEIHWVRPALHLVARLPRGLCERLLAVPVHQDSPGGRVDVAAVDALGPHVASEMGFHLQAPVRVLRARFAQLRDALSGLDARASRPPPAMPSEPPIPLVRRPPVSNRAATPEEEPVLNLSRSKLFVPEAPFAFEHSVDEALLELARAASAEQVARLLCRALEPAICLVVALRGGSLELRAASRAVGEAVQSSLSLPLDKNSVFDIALRAGFYLGPLSSGIVHAELRAFLPSAALDEVYSAPVLVANRPILALLMARFGPSLEATRRADRLLLAASVAIERILRTRKRGSST